MKISVFVFLVVLVTLVQGQQEQQVPEREELKSNQFIICDGDLEEVRIDFDTDEVGQTLQVGDTPSRLPENITVTGKRPVGGNPRPTANDLVVIDSLNPGPRNDNLRSATDDKVIIIGSSADSSRPMSSEAGGSVIFRFGSPPFQVDFIRLLGLSDGPDAQSNIVGRANLDGRLLQKQFIPPSGGMTSAFVFPVDWFDVRLMRISLKSAAAIAEIGLTVCRGGKYIFLGAIGKIRCLLIAIV